MVGFGESGDSLIILLSRAKSFRELLRCYELMIERAGRIVELLEQIGQRFTIAQP